MHYNQISKRQIPSTREWPHLTEVAPPPRDIPGPCKSAPLQCAGACGAGTGFHGNYPSKTSKRSELWELSPI